MRTVAAGVNPVDWKVRARGGFLGEPPFTVGWDVAGVVEEIGFGVTRFSVGDRVFGMPRFPREAAAYAEYVTSPSRQLAPIPDGLDDVEAGALPLAGLTAWQALVETADVRPGQRVLVLAAAGGVGHLAVQIAKARGAYVLGTARAEKHAFLVDLGVDEPIDYTSENVAERAPGSTSSSTSSAARPGSTRFPHCARAVSSSRSRRRPGWKSSRSSRPGEPASPASSWSRIGQVWRRSPSSCQPVRYVPTSRTRSRWPRPAAPTSWARRAAPRASSF